MFRFLSDKPDVSPDVTAETPAAAEPPRDPLSRTDLTSPGLLGFAERALVGAGEFRRLLYLIAALFVLAGATFAAYGWQVGFSSQGEFFNPGIALMVVGAQVALGFFPRTPDRYPYVGYTVVNAIETAAVLYIVFVIATQPLDKGSLGFLLAYALIATVAILSGFAHSTRMRRAVLILAETTPEPDPDAEAALRRALHMDR